MRIPRVPLAAVFLSSVGCASVQPVREPAQFIPKEKPEVVYFPDERGDVVPVGQAHVSGDSLLGVRLDQAEPVAVPLGQVPGIWALQPDRKRTALLIGWITVATAGGTYAILQATSGGNKLEPGSSCMISERHSDTAVCPAP